MTSKKERARDRRANDRMRDEALAEWKNGRTDRARRLLQAAISNFKTNARYWYDLGRLEHSLGNVEDSARALGKALDLRPEFKAAQKLLDQLGVPRPEPEPVVEDVVPDAPEDLTRTESFDWGALQNEVMKIGGARLEGAIGEVLAQAIDVEYGARPGRPLEDGVAEHLLSAVPEALAPFLPEWTYRGRAMNHALRSLLSGPTPPAGERVVGAMGILQLDEEVSELRWPRAEGETPFPIELGLPLSGPIELELNDAVGGKKGKLKRPLRGEPGDVLLIGAGERPVHIGGIWGRQGLIVRIVGAGDRRLLRVRIG